MTGPMLFPWATDANYAAGSDPWSSQPTKVEPSSGRKEEGFVPRVEPPASYHNWMFHRLGELVDALAGMVCGFKESDLAVVTAWAGNPSSDACYCPKYDAFWAIDENGDTLVSINPGGPVGSGLNVGGHGAEYIDERGNWVGADSPNSHATWTANATRAAIDANPVSTGTHGGKRLAVSDSATGQVCTGTTPGVWVTETPATAARNWCSCAVGRTGVFIIGNTVGNIESSDGAGTWTHRQVIPGSNPVLRIGASKDASASGTMFVALHGVQTAYTGDGLSWSLYNHGWTNPLDVAVNDITGRWLVVDDSGNIHYSDSGQGSGEWTTVSSALPSFPAAAPTVARLACFKGIWLCVTGDTTTTHMWMSTDDGETWRAIFHPKQTGYGRALAAGEMGFTLIGDSAALYSPPVLLP